jgi:23S rRNA (uracil1939-C5)-methyltransferase
VKRQEYDVLRLGAQGDGLVETQQGLLHIPKVLPGEMIELDGARLSRVVAPSPERVTPFCKHYDRCGGCKFQHWKELSYRGWKRSLVLNELQRQRIETGVSELIDAHGDGRRRVVLHVRQQDGSWRAGFMEAKSHSLIAIETCPVLIPQLAESPSIASSFGPVLGNCDVAVTLADNGLDVAVKADRKAVDRRLPVLSGLARKHSLCRLTVNNETILARETPVVEIGGVRVPLPVQSFLQATQAGEEQIAAIVTAILAKSKRVADLFCGIGPFALRLARHARVHTVDSDKAAVSSLSEAVRHAQGLKPVTTEARDLFRNPMVPQELQDFDGVVCDPPRAGAEAQFRNLARTKVRRIAYVSCDAQTFARDARMLLDGGYRLLSVAPIDQFKWTPHVEIVGEFQR